ncbi:hypothetical protein V7O62_03325 [Methanolobus sp. ZRKC2]|uniref:hypothetical protein n=1 Tax=Methanolobus sp. ZRKC2 TaxID=3125783 RepID=UPI00325479BE
MQSCSKNMVIAFISVILIATSMGCIETPAAAPALLEESALAKYGWSQEGDIEYNIIQHNISDSNSISFNSTVVNYKNNRLAADIQGQANDFRESYNIPFSPEIPMIDAWISTNTITLPAGATLPTNLISKMTNSKVNDLSEQNSIRNLSKIETRELTMKDGSVIEVSIYSGLAPSQNLSLNILGIVAAFEKDDSSIIVIGVTPNGSLPVKVGGVEADLFSIDGNREIEEMLELVTTIE